MFCRLYFFLQFLYGGGISVSKKIMFSLSKAMTIILATVFTMLLLAGCPTPEDIPAVGTKYDDEENNLRYIVNDDRTLSVIEPIDSTREDWVCIIPEKYEGIKVTSIGMYAFSDCFSLISITIPDSVTSIGNDAFSNCSGLTSITIPDTVTSIGRDAFSYCSGLTSITIPDSVTSIGKYAFWNCSSLTSITIPDTVTSIDYCAFCGCSSLTSITIPASVTSIKGGAFSECSSLTSITIPNSVTSIGDDAFSECSGLTSITIKKTNGTISGSPWGAPNKELKVYWQVES